MTQRIVFVCTKNAVRSPMAKAIAQHLLDRGEIGGVTVDSAGIDPGDVDGFAIAAMAEHQLDIQHHEAKDLQDFADTDFDLLITLSTSATTFAQQHYNTLDGRMEAWDVGDPSLIEGNRDQQLAAYRDVHALLTKKIRQRFSL